MLNIIVAASENSVIGKDNRLPWHLPSDLNHFREITTGHTIIMGRKTFESLPKILPNRHHIVLTNNTDYSIDSDDVTVVNSLHQLLQILDANQLYFVIGGGSIFNILLPYCSKVYLTKIFASFDGDTFFPSLSDDEWKITSSKEGQTDEKNIYPHFFLELSRV
jgi:dihydrofolate reductase